MAHIRIGRRIRAACTIVSKRVDRNGYTLVEVIWVLTLFLLLLSILASVHLSLRTQLSMDEHRTQAIQEGQAFFAFISREVEAAVSLSSTGSQELRLVLRDGTDIRYWLDGRNVIRQSKTKNEPRHSGYTILLQNVAYVNYAVSLNGRAVQIDVMTEQGQRQLTFSNYLTTNISANP